MFGENIQRVSETREIHCGRNFFRCQKRVYSRPYLRQGGTILILVGSFIRGVEFIPQPCAFPDTENMA